MHQGSSVRLTAWVYDPEARRQVILGGAVLLLSSIVVVLVHIASTTPEFITKLRLYVSPESARVCSLARLWFAPCVAVAGFAGCVTCLILAFREARKTKNKRESLLELQESTHWSYLIHATILAFICLMGIVSKPHAFYTSKSLVIEFAKPDSLVAEQFSAVNRRAGQLVSTSSKNEPHRKVSTVSHVVTTEKPSSSRSFMRMIPPPLTSVITSEIPYSPYASLPTPPPSSNSMYSSAFVQPAVAVRDSSVDCAIESPKLGSPSDDLAATFESGEGCGLISKDGSTEDAFGESVDDEMEPNQSPPRFATFDPHYLESFSIEAKRDADRVRLPSRQGISLDMTPPSPHSVSNHQKFNMVAAEVPQNDLDHDITCTGPPPRELDQCGHYIPFMQDLRKRVYQCMPLLRTTLIARSVVTFSVSRRGEVSKIKLVRSSGQVKYDNDCLRAVQLAAPFQVLPKCAPESVDIQFAIEFNAVAKQMCGYPKRRTAEW